jgi:hypothetical protein
MIPLIIHHSSDVLVRPFKSIQMNGGSWYLSLVINFLLYSSNMHCMLLDIDETLP